VKIQHTGGTTVDYKERITTNPNIMLGKPCIKGTRITVELLLRKLSEGMTVEELLGAYPHLTKEDIFASLSYSADVISQEELIAT
jgi:uncharacterized protein (DUF433 family)